MPWRVDLHNGIRKYRHSNGSTYFSVSSIVGLLTGMDWSSIKPQVLDTAIRHGNIAHDAGCRHFSAMMIGEQPKEIYLDADNAEVYNQSLKCFKDWSKQWKVKPIAVEQVVHCDNPRIAGTIDLLCELDPHGKGKKVKAVVDFKRTHAVTHSHTLQVRAYRMCKELDGCHMYIMHMRKGGGYAMHRVAPSDASKSAIVSAYNVLNYREGNYE